MNQVIITGTIVHKFPRDNEKEIIAFIVDPLNEHNENGNIKVKAFKELSKLIDDNFPVGTRVGLKGYISPYKNDNSKTNKYMQDIVITYIEYLEKKTKEPLQKEEMEQEL